MKRFLLALILLPGPAFGAKSRASPVLKVLTFNVAGIPILHPHWQRRLHAIGPRLKEADYDLVALQEIWRNKDALALYRESEMPYFAHYERKIALETGLAILSRFPILEKHQREFTCRPSKLRLHQGESLVNKGILMVRVMTPKGLLDVYNTHLISDYPEAKYRTLRLTQVYELAEMVEEYSPRTPFLIMGDLNAGPRDPEYKILVDLLGLEDACLRRGSEVCGRTSGERRIDHIFLPQGRRSRIEAGLAFAGPIPGTGISYSDHSAVAARLDEGIVALRLKPVLELRAQALRKIQSEIAQMMQTMGRRLTARSWIPVYGFVMSLRYNHQLAQLTDIKTRVETARILALGRRNAPDARSSIRFPKPTTTPE